MVEARSASPSPGPQAPAPSPSPPDLPPIAAKADDLEAIKKGVDDAATVGGGLWLSYLFVLFYLAVAAGAVTHADLFLENPVKLPFLNVELPLLAFFFLAPILFLFVHAYTLVHLVFLTDKGKRFDEALNRQIGDDSGAAKDGEDPRIAAIAGVRGQLPSNIFIQFLAGPRDRRAGSFGWLLRVIAWSTLAVAPILLLLLFQIQFLPFHNGWVTSAHRLALVADLFLIWWLWRKILSGRASVTPRPAAVWWWRAVGALLTVCTVLFSFGLATFPGEWQTERLAAWKLIHERGQFEPPIMVSVHDWLFESRINDTTRRRRWPLSSTLVLAGFNIYEGLNIDDPDKLKGRDFVFRARGRDLKGAIFDLATLQKVDFEGADLHGASLAEAKLQGAHLSRAQLQGASLTFAQLQGASLTFAQLQGASLTFAQLQGVELQNAYLQGAWLAGVQLQGASLMWAQLQGADLERAKLQGAALGGAQLQGASLLGADLRGASLAKAQLQGAVLDRAFLEATDLSGAALWRTDRTLLPPDSFDAQSHHQSLTASAIQMSSGDNTWLPIWKDHDGQNQPWDNTSYQALRTTIESLPPGNLRDQALKRIQSLECPGSDNTLAPCDPLLASVPPLKLSPEAAEWRQALGLASVGKEAYASALAQVLKELVCSEEGHDTLHVVHGSRFQDAIHVMHGTGFQGGLWNASSAAIELIDDLTNKDSKDCPVAAALTDADRAKLLPIKREAIETAITEATRRSGFQ